MWHLNVSGNYTSRHFMREVSVAAMEMFAVDCAAVYKVWLRKKDVTLLCVCACVYLNKCAIMRIDRNFCRLKGSQRELKCLRLPVKISSFTFLNGCEWRNSIDLLLLEPSCTAGRREIRKILSLYDSHEIASIFTFPFLSFPQRKIPITLQPRSFVTANKCLRIPQKFRITINFRRYEASKSSLLRVYSSRTFHTRTST